MNTNAKLMTTDALVQSARRSTASRSERHAAFAHLVDQHQDVALRCAYRALGDSQLAQDATQEAFITAYQKLPQLRDPTAFPSWLLRIVRTYCNRLTRGKSILTTPLIPTDETPSPNADPARLLLDQDRKDHILTAIATLPEHEQIVVRLFYLDGYAIKEVAAALELPITTIKKRLQYARARLRTQLVEIVETVATECQERASDIVEYLLPMTQPVLQPVPVTCPQVMPAGRYTR